MWNHFRFVRIGSGTVFAILVVTGALLADPGRASYRIEDLGTFGGPDSCEEGVFPTWAVATGLNESGHTIGGAEHSEQLLDPDTGEPLFYPDTGHAVCSQFSHPALWRNGEIVDLGGFQEGGTAEALGVNDHDHVVGGARVDSTYRYHPFLWTEEGGMVDLMADSAVSGVATAINNFGEITIMARGAYFRDVDGNLRRIRFPDSPDWGSDEAWDINDDGIVVGAARRENAGGFFHAFRYDSKADTIEDIHDPFYIQSFGYGLNEGGDIAFETTAYTWHGFSAVLTHDGNLVVLPLGNMRVRGELRPDLLYGGIEDVNAHGDVIGSDVSVAHRGAEPWVAFDVLGDGPIEKIPLEDLLSPEDRAEWEIWWVRGLNDARQIVGYAGHNGKARAFLMTPEESASDGDAGLQATTGPVSGGEPSRVEIETAARIEAVARVVPDSLGPNRAVGSLRPRPSIEPRETAGVRNLEPASGPDGRTSQISRPVPLSTPRGAATDDDLGPFDRNHDPAGNPRQPGPDRSSGPTTPDDG